MTAVEALDVAVRRARRPQQRAMLALMAPALLFLGAFFVVPIGEFLARGVANPEIPGALPSTIAALAAWDGGGAPDEPAYAALVADLGALGDRPELIALARRLNDEVPGYRSLVLRTARWAAEHPAAPYKAAVIALDARWGGRAIWSTIRRERLPVTAFYLLSALDLRLSARGVERTPAESAVFVEVLGRTLVIAGSVTMLCLAIGFPVAAVIAGARPAVANLLFMVVLLPFWSSLLVRAIAWIVLLQNQGVVNHALIDLGLIDAPVTLIFNRFGLLVAMTHVLLPFMILPLHAVLKTIPREHMRAAAALGAGPITAFRRVYLPQALPGIAAGSALVFVISLGYYIVPALVGGPREQMIGYFIAYFTSSAVDWGMASALGIMLLATTALIYVGLVKAIGIERLRVR